ncbi:type II toxin-antitoxin system ParD family antitoxin, partial [Salmonella enterica subsp. enterica serovar Anatum]|nr:type II toxin-antitoxin system ParD family antitoxin [Salmonella enterica subsp. enterica serovar Anatum]MEA7614559.1 type II toxin-antitoxin system ParD family antitoxin [Salmonella enterica subsp. enterica serovar Anatum]
MFLTYISFPVYSYVRFILTVEAV